MAFTYTWQDLITVVNKLGKGIPTAAISPQICDFISSEMYTVYPWKTTITTVAANSLPLLDGVQDYSSPINIYRLTKATVVRSDVTPNDYFDLDIVDDNAVDLLPRSYRTIRSVSQQQGSGTLRLEAAVQVPAGMQLDLRGEYQLNPIKIVALTQGLWFADQYALVAVEGLLYWIYKLSDDTRAGTVGTDGMGRGTSYTGQLAIYKAALYKMQTAEDWGASNGLFPSEPFGIGRDMNSLNIFGW